MDAPAPTVATPRRRTDLAALALGWALLAARWPGLVAGRVLPSSQDGLGISDLYDVTLPLRHWVAATRAAGRDPAWFPYAYGGLPTAAIPEASPHYPVTAALFAVERPETALAHALWLHLALALTGAYLLVRRLGGSPAAALFAGLAVGGGLWLPEHFRQVNVVETAAWLPLVWFAAESALQSPSRRTAAGVGLCVGVMALAGHAQMLHHAALATVVLVAARLHARPDLSRARALAALAAGALGGSLVGAATLAPLAEAVSLSDLSRRSSAVGGVFTGHIGNLLSVLHPALVGTPDAPRFGGVAWEETAYVGAAAPWLAALAWRARRTPAARAMAPLALTLLACVALAYLSAAEGLGALARAIPGMASTRFHTRFLWPASVALAAMAALSLDALAAGLDARRRTVLGAAVAFALSADLALASWSRCPVAAPGELVDEPETARLIRARHGAGAHREGRVVTLVGARRRAGLNALPYADEGTVALSFGRPRMHGEAPSRWGWSTLRGYVGLVPRGASLALGDQHAPGDLDAVAAGCDAPGAAGCAALARFLEAHGARWVIASEALLDGVAEVVGEVRSPLRWVVYRLRDTRPALALEDDRGASTPVRGSASVGPARFDATVDASGPGWLVRDQAWHPRTRCTVDGAPAPAQDGGWLLRVRVPAAGRHRVACRYDPSLERRSAALSLGAFALLTALALTPRGRASSRRGRASPAGS